MPCKFKLLSSNVFDVPTGLIAYFYLWHWKIEKFFNTFKSGLGKIKAWANGKVAQAFQVSIMAIAYNTLVATFDILDSPNALTLLILIRP